MKEPAGGMSTDTGKAAESLILPDFAVFWDG